jgi:DNA invertase Pin-like site-specific DNA recombinase
MMAAFAELERNIIHERTMVGLAAARAEGPRRAASCDGPGQTRRCPGALRQPCGDREGAQRQLRIGIPAPER